MGFYKLSKIETSKNVIIYGAGEIGEQYYHQIVSDYCLEKVSYFLETRPLKLNILNLKILSLEDLELLNIENFTYLITSIAGKEEMVNNLKNLGVLEENIIIPRDLELQNLIPQKQISDNFDVYPIIENEEDLNSLLLKLSWFFPSDISLKNRITIFMKNSLKNINNRIKTDKISKNVQIEFEGNFKFNNNSNNILLWNVDNFEDLPIERRSKIFVIDKNYFKNIDITNLIRLYCYSIPEKQREYYYKKSIENFYKMDFSQYDRSTLFAPGPSVNEAYSHSFNDSFNVICNSVVKNKKLLKHIKPNLITFADSVGHFSDSNFSKEFRRDVILAVEEFGASLLIPRELMPLLSVHYPKLIDATIGIETKISKQFNFPNANSFWVKSTSNVATRLTIPFVSSFFDNIFMYGFDGKDKNPRDIHSTQVWGYSKESHTVEIADQLYNDYPAYFKGVQDDFYYNLHSNTLSDLLDYGEKLGKKYITKTYSYFPCLAKRHKK